MKLKKDYVKGSGIGGDTVDLVPIGGYLGKGRRRGLFGSFLMACIDNNDSSYLPVCKLGSGFSDAILQEIQESLTAQVGLKGLKVHRL